MRTTGYTHYLYVKVDTPQEKIDAVMPDLLKLIESTEVPLAGMLGKEGTVPRLGYDYIGFNGVGPDAHETFSFPPTLVGEDAYHPMGDTTRVFDCCKTARKPYDAVVVACLLRIEAVIGEPWVTIHTDASDIEEYMSDQMSEGWANVNQMLNGPPPEELLDGLGLGGAEVLSSGSPSNPIENVHEETAAQLYYRVFGEPPPIPACFKDEVRS